jgi:hypothetical protein
MIWFVVTAVGSGSAGLAAGFVWGDWLRRARKETLDWFSEWNESRKAADWAADRRVLRENGPLP